MFYSRPIFATLDHQKFLLARACLSVSVTSTFLRATQPYRLQANGEEAC